MKVDCYPDELVRARIPCRNCTAEQTLSHLLPPLAGVSRAIVKVERTDSRE